MTRIRRLALTAAVLSLACACVSSELSVPANHPGNPQASSGRLAWPTALADGTRIDAAPSAPLEAAPVPAHPAHHGSPGAADASPAASFSCPMHPEIVRDKPGKCPICGMQLVPKQVNE